ncbi:MAG: sugar phosphate isomerase/epimerase family protein [Planctomycetota bacterium]|jgi:sugar phosphate isomerase/epimerase
MKFSLTRRQMILGSIRAVAGLTLTTACQPFKVGKGRVDAAKQGFKIGVCDWTLKKGAESASFELASRIGVDGVQIAMGVSGDETRLCRPEVQKEFREAARRYNLKIVSMAIGELNKVPYKGNEPRVQQWVYAGIDVCRAMEMKVLLLPFFGKGDLKNDKKGTDVVIEKLKAAASKAEEAGVVLGLESWLSAEEHMHIIEQVGSEAVMVYYDVGNSHKKGYDIYQEIRFLGKHICEFHAKDYSGLFGKGSIDFKEMRLAIDDIGYRGWIHIEPVKMPFGMEQSCRYNVKYMRNLFPSTVS